MHATSFAPSPATAPAPAPAPARTPDPSPVPPTAFCQSWTGDFANIISVRSPAFMAITWTLSGGEGGGAQGTNPEEVIRTHAGYTVVRNMEMNNTNNKQC